MVIQISAIGRNTSSSVSTSPTGAAPLEAR